MTRTAAARDPLTRLRRLCLALPGTSERVSHGEPTFFVGKKVFAMFANDHHGDGHVAVWLPAPPGVQGQLIEAAPRTFFRPPYVGVRGWVGVELARIRDADLAFHVHVAWELIAPKRLLAEAAAGGLVGRDPARLRGARRPTPRGRPRA